MSTTSTLILLDDPSTFDRFDITIPQVPVAANRSRSRLTRRGQVVLVVAFLGLALALMTLFGGWATASRDSAPAASVRVVTVAPGESLYVLAGRVAEPGHVRDMVRRIIDLNSLSGATLQPGQKIAVPRG